MRNELRFLIVAVVVMLVGVLASLGILSRAATSLRAAHENIVDEAAPSVVALDDAQARLLRLHTLVLERRLGAPGDPAVREASIKVVRHELESAAGEYLALPSENGAAPFRRAIRESLAQVDLVLDRALSAPPDEVGPQHDLDDAMTGMGLELARASEFSAQVAKGAAGSVVEVSKYVLPLAAAIVGLTFLAAALTLGLTYRAVRRAEALWTKSRTALDRRAEELELFAARVAHDLLSPLMTVSLALDLANHRLGDPEDAPARGAVGRAKRTLERVRRFVSDLLEFARAGAQPVAGARASVDDVVREIADELTPIAHDAGVDLRLDPPSTGREVACSPGVLTSVLTNLVQNAIRYIGEGEERRVCIRAAGREGEVRVEVEDTGPGIPPAERDRLFEPYARGRNARAPGLGLGLATVRRLVESHGGHVGVQTAPGHGSVFWFSLPAAT